MPALSKNNLRNNQHAPVARQAAAWFLAALLGVAPLAAIGAGPTTANSAGGAAPSAATATEGDTAKPPAGQLKTLVILDFELDDSSGVVSGQKAQAARLVMASQLLRQEFARNHLYTVVDNTPAAQLIADTKNRLVLHDCNGCDTDIGRALKADRVLTAWVQKVSNLILQINIRIRDVKTDNVMVRKQITIRGNTDKSWSRGIDFIVRDMIDKNEGNR